MTPEFQARPAPGHGATRTRPGAVRPWNPHLNDPCSTQNYSDTTVRSDIPKARTTAINHSRSVCPSTFTSSNNNYTAQYELGSTEVPPRSATKIEDNLRKFDKMVGVNSSITIIPGSSTGVVITKQHRDLTRDTPVKVNAWETRVEGDDTQDSTSKCNPGTPLS